MNYHKKNILKLALIGYFTLFHGYLIAGESSDPIKFAINNWSSQQVLTHVSGELLKQAGYNVEYHLQDTHVQFQALGNGDVHVQMEIWEGTMASSFEQQLTSKRMIDAGNHQAVSREEWWYPDYMEDICPGLPDWKALNDCFEILATDSTHPNGRYLAGPVDWERSDRERIEALGLKFEIINVASPMGLWAELETASKNKLPIVLLNWIPNWIEAKYPGKFVEFPTHHPDCETDAAWGDNPQLTHDCGNPVEGWLKRGVWSGFPEKWTCAFEFIKNINFTNEQIVIAAAYAEVDEMSPEEAANRWISENEDLWNSWKPACAETLSLETDTESTDNSLVSAASEKHDDVQFETLAKQGNCLGCHGVDIKLVGPSFMEVSAKYVDDSTAVEMLFNKIKNGGSGNWGDIPMPPNPSISEDDIHALINWILSLK